LRDFDESVSYRNSRCWISRRERFNFITERKHDTLGISALCEHFAARFWLRRDPSIESDDR